jgi:4-hydroxy-tetrahydrodipicolinate synthase
MRRLFTGCGTALVTPFTRDGALDQAGVARLARRQIDAGIHFLVPCGSTGKTPTLTPEERSLVVRTVVETARDRVPVMAGATHNDTRQAVEEAQRISALGVSWLLSATPYYNKPSPEGQYRHFMAVADASAVPLVLYNVPGRTAVNMRPDTVLRLAEHPNIIGIKESSGDLAQVQHLLLGRPDDFAVLSGEDWLTLAIIAAGGDGLVSVASNEIPRLMSQLVRRMLRGQLPEAREILYQILPLLEANFLETNPAPVKAALHGMGRIHDVLRLPLVPLSESRRPALFAALREAGVETSLAAGAR